MNDAQRKQAEKIGTKILDWAGNWPEKSKGRTFVIPITVNDVFCHVTVEPKGYWSEMQAKQTAENVKWIMGH